VGSKLMELSPKAAPPSCKTSEHISIALYIDTEVIGVAVTLTGYAKY